MVRTERLELQKAVLSRIYQTTNDYIRLFISKTYNLLPFWRVVWLGHVWSGLLPKNYPKSLLANQCRWCLASDGSIVYDRCVIASYKTTHGFGVSTLPYRFAQVMPGHHFVAALVVCQEQLVVNIHQAMRVQGRQHCFQ